MPDRRVMVVDADVAMAAGRGHRPPVPECLRILTTILSVCHRVAFTPELREEWKRHASRQARRWLKQMVGRKKLVDASSPTKARAMRSDGTLAGLEKAIDRRFPRDEERDEVRKDLHLVCAAVECGAAVISNDDTARRRLRQLAHDCRPLGSVEWVNPSCPAENVDAWLHKGAPVEPGRLLAAGGSTA